MGMRIVFTMHKFELNTNVANNIPLLIDIATILTVHLCEIYF